MLTLETSFTLNELCRWKFHWAICRIDEAIKFDSIREVFPRRYEKLTLDDIQKVIDSVQAIAKEMSRFMWEINTMSDNDYTVDLIKLLSTHEKYQKYLEKLKFANDAILQMTDEVLGHIRKNTEQQLEKLDDKYFY